MTQAQLGLLIGGFIPAVLFGIAGFFQKVSTNQGITLGVHLISIGVGVVVVGITLCIFQSEQSFTIKKAIPSLVVGMSWGLGMTLVALAIIKYAVPLSVITPLYNMNTLVTVAAALIIFSEWKDVNMAKLVLGSLLIVGGGILVSS